MTVYSAQQIAAAKIIWDFWKSKGCDEVHRAAWIGNVDGECSLKGWLVGDHGTAYGIDQDHMNRVNEILNGCGIDMRTATLEKQLEGTYWEITDPKAWYKAVWPKFQAAHTLWSAVSELVSGFEQSSAEGSDVQKRVAYAEYWISYAQANNWE